MVCAFTGNRDLDRQRAGPRRRRRFRHHRRRGQRAGAHVRRRRALLPRRQPRAAGAAGGARPSSPSACAPGARRRARFDSHHGHLRSGRAAPSRLIALSSGQSPKSGTIWRRGRSTCTRAKRGRNGGCIRTDIEGAPAHCTALARRHCRGSPRCWSSAVLLRHRRAQPGEYHVYSCRTPSGESAPADGWSGSIAAERLNRLDQDTCSSKVAR